MRQDVAVAGGRIVALGQLADSKAKQVIDANGRVIAPGFIDIHSHSDWTLLLNPQAESSIRQGVTTEVVGNCGMSYAPVWNKTMLLTLVPTYLRDQVDIKWRSFGEYLDTLRTSGSAINIVHLVGHLALRIAVMGFDARPPSPSELEEMQGLLEESLASGAGGLSFGLEYSPGSNASREELVALARVAARRSLLCSIHVRSQDYGYIAALKEAIDFAAQVGANLQISHITPHAGLEPGIVDRALCLVRRGREEGVDVNFDAHPYSRNMTFLTTYLPPWAFEGGTSALLQRLADPGERHNIKQYRGRLFQPLYDLGQWDRFVVCYSQNSHDLVGKSIAEIGRARQVDADDAIMDIMLREGEGIHSLMWLVEGTEESAIPSVLSDAEGMVASDGLALSSTGPLSELSLHPRCWGWTARLLGYFVREQRLLRLEEAVHKITGMAASKIGLRGRGIVAEGKSADLVVFDPGTIKDRATYENPNQPPSGIDCVIVNGQIVLGQTGQNTTLPGEVLLPGR